MPLNVPRPDLQGIFPWDLVESLTNMVYGEGGSTLARAASNVMQVIHNRAISAWTSQRDGINWRGRRWASISQSDFRNLVHFIAGERGTGGHGTVPAFNAWVTRNMDPNPMPSDVSRWGQIRVGVDTWLRLGAGTSSQAAPISVEGQPPSGAVRDSAVLYYFSFPAAREGFAYEHDDPCAGGRHQYYFTPEQWGVFNR